MSARRPSGTRARYVALLRGVSPMNCQMPALKRCFESAGFTDVKTLLSSGNVAFSAEPAIVPVLEAAVEAAMEEHLDRRFMTIVRPASFLQGLIARDPFAGFTLPAGGKRVLTFLRRPHEGALDLPIRLGNAAVLGFERTEAFCVYVPEEKGPVFMTLLERTFGKDITTRTWDTVARCAGA